MLREGVQRNLIAYSAAISACGKGVQSQQALELFEQMQVRRTMHPAQELREEIL